MAWTGRQSGPHGSGAELEDIRGWRALLHLASELQLARLSRFMLPYKRRAALGVVAMLIYTATGLAIPYLVKIAIDSGIGQGDLAVLTQVIVTFIALAVVNLGASYAMTYLVSYVGQCTIFDIRRALFAHIQKLTLDFFGRQKTGWIVSRLTNDIDALDQLVTDGVTSLVTNGLTLIGATVLLFVLDWRLALATLAVMPFLIASTLVFRSHSARSYAKVRERIADVSAHLQESLSGIRTVEAFRREEADTAQLDELNAEYRNVNMETVVQSGLYFPFVEFLSAVALVVVLWFGGWLATGGQLEIGVLVAFIGYLAMFFDPVQQLSQLYNTFQSSMAAVKKIFTVLDTEPDLMDAPDAVALPDVRGQVHFDHVTFSYDKQTDVIHGIDITLPAGSTVALVGPTGAGKSTLIKLLARFYDPDEGALTIDGYDLRKVTTKSLREQLAVVPQEAFLFTGSIVDNIRFARPEASDDEVRRVARIVGAHDFIEDLENGYDTDVKEGGSGLSTGQRQLVSFARALLADPRILILDEATSSVDAESEKRIEQAMGVLFNGRTSVIVAHRLSTVRYADRIFVVDGGRVVEQGDHDELFAARGRYWRLYTDWERTGQAL
jgi:ABC-type multidrug transport system fused ATPase/permease subunit